ncbi:HugZ family protein [Rhizobium sp. RU36D]|uniref:HugZ family pyridoxamine 5'-phosphate oxidase n=1 Tax=Rhizobium sp. RU36D TaxID=1907415 RepID=UPI0009D7D515|nr:HugZ family protein [Rhizobium sp. RU36D]SMD03452.1 hypothetical protein SAMN05880593_116117 [Rhizobium sp. RU36D]
MADKSSVIRETDEDARRLARTLYRGARHVALAVIDPETSFPFASRVLMGADIDGAGVILVSRLSAHTRALDKDPRASILAGEPGKGDPLAHPRLTLQCLAEPVDRDSADHGRLRSRFLARHPKAKLYADFPDFRFFRMIPQHASLNGGFGRAFLLEAADFRLPPISFPEIVDGEAGLLRNLVIDFPDIADRIARGPGKANHGKWQLCGIDSGGIDLISGDNLLRHEFDDTLTDLAGIIKEITKTAYPIP